MIAALPESEKERLRKRYGPLTLTPDKIKFIDRLVAYEEIGADLANVAQTAVERWKREAAVKA